MALMSSAYASVSFYATVVNKLTLPTDFSSPWFVLDKLWFAGPLPGFPITGPVTTRDIAVSNQYFNMPGLQVKPSSSQPGLRWYYFCDGLTIDYSHQPTTATLVFEGNVNPLQPGTGLT